jgi:hydrogenase expression/formation protein HypC
MCMSRLHRVVELVGPGEVRTVDVDGATHQVSLLVLGGTHPPPGSWLVVHSGYAVDRVDATEAAGVLELQRRAGAAPGAPRAEEPAQAVVRPHPEGYR